MNPSNPAFMRTEVSFATSVKLRNIDFIIHISLQPCEMLAAKALIVNNNKFFLEIESTYLKGLSTQGTRTGACISM